MNSYEENDGVVSTVEDEFSNVDSIIEGDGLGNEDSLSQDTSENSQDNPGFVERVQRSKRTGKGITAKQKVINTILKRAKKSVIPSIKHLLKGKFGNEVAIKDVAMFIGDEQGDEVMNELAQKCPVRNTVNLSAEVGKKRMIDVGVQILESDRMYYPIHVARIKDGGKNDGKLECISGRHRLAFYALVYGPDTKIPVYLEEMTTNEARDAVVFANQSRATKALEKAEHSVLQAVQGDVSATLEDMYTRTVTCKSKIRRYCVFSVINRGLPMKLSFPVSTTSTRKGGYLTTLANVEGFWRSALEWTDGTTFKDFDASLKSSVKFLNALVDEMQKVKGFKSTEHLATKQLVAIGKYYRSYGEFTGNNAIKKVAEIAKCIVKQGDIGGQKSEKTYAMLTKSLVFGKGK